MATDTPPADAGECRRSVVRSSPEVPFSGFYSRANAAAEAATTKGEFRKLGGSSADYTHDLKHKFITEL